MTTGTRATEHASATVTVCSSDATTYEDRPGPGLAEVRIVESFESPVGVWDGESTVRALETRNADGTASLVTQQRFVGRLGGRDGTFVLQGRADVTDGTIRASWTVVPGSGTGDLTGLRGKGGFVGRFGQGSEATLDYWFD